MTVESSVNDDEAGARGGAGSYGDYLAERDEVLRHKWVLSERQGRDVGFETALMDWAQQHRTVWRRQRSRRGPD
jgi:hypothetical protein